MPLCCYCCYCISCPLIPLVTTASSRRAAAVTPFRPLGALKKQSDMAIICRLNFDTAFPEGDIWRDSHPAPLLTKHTNARLYFQARFNVLLSFCWNSAVYRIMWGSILAAKSLWTLFVQPLSLCYINWTARELRINSYGLSNCYL